MSVRSNYSDNSKIENSEMNLEGKKLVKINDRINSEIYRRLFLKYPDWSVFKNPAPISSIEDFKKKPIIDFIEHFNSFFYTLKSGFDIDYDEVIDKREYIKSQIKKTKKAIKYELLDYIPGIDSSGAKMIIRRGFEIINKEPMTLIIQLPFVLSAEINNLVKQESPGLIYGKSFLDSNGRLNLSEDEFLDEITYLFFHGVALFRYIVFLKEKIREFKEVNNKAAINSLGLAKETGNISWKSERGKIKLTKQPEDFKSLKEIFKSEKAYLEIMSQLVSEGLVEGEDLKYRWIDITRGYRSRIAALIYHLYLLDYFNTDKLPKALTRQFLAKNGFGVDISLSLLKRKCITELRKEFKYIKGLSK